MGTRGGPLVVRSIPLTPLGSNCYLVGDPASREAILIDPGEWSPAVEALTRPEGYRVTRVLLTHGHFDHVSGAAEAARALGAPLWLHADDRPQLDRLPQLAQAFGFGATDAPPIDHLPVDGEPFAVGAEEGRIIHTPGHSPGGVCLWFPASKLLFTGDTLFAGSVGRTDLPGGDWATLERSIRERLFPLGDEVRFFPGHGPSALLGEERRTNPFVGERAR
ncbi:MAG TPA: MBL fold metallo-hydrolase [Anaeromyxobacteraceae bacterium]|nr:MBL fold metallo-hydrolase [Anaeromyxobacteraceae bacterium]